MAEVAQLDAASLPSSVVREEVVSALLEFLEASVHQILHSRSLYSVSLFERRRLYGTVVQAARHPGLVKYIQGVIQSVKVRPGYEEAAVLERVRLNRLFSQAQGALLASELDKLVIALNTDRGEVVEQFVFDMPVSPDVPGFV